MWNGPLPCRKRANSAVSVTNVAWLMVCGGLAGDHWIPPHGWGSRLMKAASASATAKNRAASFWSWRYVSSHWAAASQAMPHQAVSSLN